jgi:methyl-accepting chemotaxis protein
MDARNKRKKYFIDKEFQTKFIMRFCLVVLISSMAIGWLLFYLSRGSTTVAIENTKVMVKPTADFILPQLIATLLIVTVFSSLVVIIMTLFASHKISGPLYRLNKEIELLKAGDLTSSFTIRNKDQLKDLADNLGGMCDTLREKHKDLKAKSAALKKYLEARNYTIAGDEKEDFVSRLDEIIDILGYFKV